MKLAATVVSSTVTLSDENASMTPTNPAVSGTETQAPLRCLLRSRAALPSWSKARAQADQSGQTELGVAVRQIGLLRFVAHLVAPVRPAGSPESRASFFPAVAF